MEDGVLVAELLAALAHALLAGRQGAEVLDGLGHGVAEEAHDDAAGRDAVDLDVEVDLVRDRLEVRRRRGEEREARDEGDGGGGELEHPGAERDRAKSGGCARGGCDTWSPDFGEAGRAQLDAVQDAVP